MYFIPIDWSKKLRKMIFKKGKFSQEEINFINSELITWYELILFIRIRFREEDESLFKYYDKQSLLNELKYPPFYS